MTEPVSEDIINDIKAQIIESYNVDTEDVILDDNYFVEGKIQLDTYDEDKIDDIISSIKDSISEVTGVTSKKIEVSVNKETGVMSYKVKSDSFDTASDILDKTLSPTFEAELTDSINNKLENVTSVVDIVADNDVHFEVIASIDASKATADVSKATQDINDIFNDFVIVVEGN